MTMLERVPKIQDSPTAVEFKYQSGNIEFQNVSFGHKKESVESSQFLFQDLNLTFKAGTTNAIVGPSGFGKTSMLHLIFRIYDPEVGCVKIDG
jgi:ABC-type multidrug transport system fused ATPase/permease subunit